MSADTGIASASGHGGSVEFLSSCVPGKPEARGSTFRPLYAGVKGADSSRHPARKAPPNALRLDGAPAREPPPSSSGVPTTAVRPGFRLRSGRGPRRSGLADDRPLGAPPSWMRRVSVAKRGPTSSDQPRSGDGARSTPARPAKPGPTGRKGLGSAVSGQDAGRIGPGPPAAMAGAIRSFTTSVLPQTAQARRPTASAARSPRPTRTGVEPVRPVAAQRIAVFVDPVIMLLPARYRAGA